MAFKDNRDLIRLMEREMQQIHDEALRTFFTLPIGGTSRFWQPSVDVHETENSLLIKMELAGTRAEDLHVSLSPDDRILTISGVRSEPAQEREGRFRCHQLEIYFGPFERSLALPSGVLIDRDGITASYRDGFLQVMLPKRAEHEKKTRLIPISNAEAATEQETKDTP
jgi:HSP20 family protein